MIGKLEAGGLTNNHDVHDNSRNDARHKTKHGQQQHEPGNRRLALGRRGPR